MLIPTMSKGLLKIDKINIWYYVLKFMNQINRNKLAKISLSLIGPA